MLKTQLRTRLARWLSGGGLRPVAVVVFLAAFFVAFPDRNLSLRDADAAPLSSPACASGVGVGGTKNAAVASTIGGHGCVVIKYVSSGTPQYETFNYTGADQTWTVPSGVTSATFFLLGAGGGGSDSDRHPTYSGGNVGAVVSITIACAPAMLFAPVGTDVDVIALPAVSVGALVNT